MSRTKGSKNRLTIEVKDKIEAAFRIAAGDDNAGLLRLEKDHPAVFYGMVSKLIPQQATLAVTHTLIDLGDEMQKAANRLNDMRLANSIEHDDTPPPSQPIDNIDESDLT